MLLFLLLAMACGASVLMGSDPPQTPLSRSNSVDKGVGAPAAATFVGPMNKYRYIASPSIPAPSDPVPLEPVPLEPKSSDVVRDAVLSVAGLGADVDSPLPKQLMEAAAPLESLEVACWSGVRELRAAMERELERAEGDLASTAVRDQARSHLDDFTLARFVQARPGSVDEAATMFRRTMRWRVERDVEGTWRELHVARGRTGERTARNAAAREHFYAGFCGCAVDGSPVFVERLGKFDVAGANRDPKVLELMLDCFVSHLESVFRAVRLASAVSAQLVKGTIIVDLAGLGSSAIRNIGVIVQVGRVPTLPSPPSPTFAPACAQIAKIGTSYFPETVGHVAIINAPWVFWAGWKFVTPLLPPHTRSKISIRASGHNLRLKPRVEPSELPSFLHGGTKRIEDTAVPRAMPIPRTLGATL